MVALALTRTPLSPVPAATGRWATSTEIGDFVQRRASELHLAGLAVVVVRDGEIYHESYIGASSDGRQVSGSTPFALGSTSKQFTGLAIQHLISDGSLSLDDKIGDLLTAFASPSDEKAGITVRELLAQTSGLSTTTGLEQWGWRPGKPGSIMANADELAGARLDRVPGTTFEYSNSNYDLLGAIVEQVTGLPFERALKLLVTDPLGLDRTTARPDARDAAVGAYPWFQSFTLTTPSAHTPGAVASAFEVSTAEDLTRLVRAHLGSLTTGMPTQVLSGARSPLTAIDEYVQYASGWFVRPLWEMSPNTDYPLADSELRGLPSCLDHPGNTPRTQSFLLVCPTEGMGLVTLTNTSAGTDTQAWARFQSDLTYVILGTPAPEYGLSFIEVNAPLVLLGVLALQGVTVLLLFGHGGRRLTLSLIAATVAVAAVAAAWVWLPRQQGYRVPLPALWDNAPDVAVVTAVSTILAAICFITVGIRTFRRRREFGLLDHAAT